MRFYDTSDEAGVELRRLADTCPEPFKLKAKAFDAMSQECADAAAEAAWESDGRESVSAWANEGLSKKYKMLADIARHQGSHSFRVLVNVETDKITTIGPVPVVNSFSGKTDYKWKVDHTGRDRAYIPYAPKRPSTLLKHGFREAWVILPATVGTEANSFNKTKHYSAGASHVYKIKTQTLYDLQLSEDVIKQYNDGFGIVFTPKEQDHVLRKQLSEAELSIALT